MESSKTSSDILLPPGFRFHPSDEELIVHYLKNKVASNPLPASVVADIDLYKYDPWELPRKALFGEDEWYFFTPRDRKYPNGARPNRAAASGYWKATGTDKPILNSSGTTSVGVKKALVFYKGRPPKGIKTDWIMHEYRLLDAVIWNPKRKGCMRLDDWVLCRVRQKSSNPLGTWEGRNGPSYERAGHFPRVNELRQANTNSNIEMIKSYLYNDCPMLPYIFASQDLPCSATVSSISFQCSEKSCTSVNKNNSDDKNFQFSVTSFDNLLNPTKRKPVGRKGQENEVPPSKKLTNREIEKEDLISISNDASDVNFCVTDQSESSNFSPAPWSSLLQYRELNDLAFTESD